MREDLWWHHICSGIVHNSSKMKHSFKKRQKSNLSHLCRLLTITKTCNCKFLEGLSPNVLWSKSKWKTVDRSVWRKKKWHLRIAWVRLIYLMSLKWKYLKVLRVFNESFVFSQQKRHIGPGQNEWTRNYWPFLRPTPSNSAALRLETHRQPYTGWRMAKSSRESREWEASRWEQ